MPTQAELDELWARFSAIQSAGAKVLSNATLAKKALDKLKADSETPSTTPPVDTDPPEEEEPPVEEPPTTGLPSGVTLKAIDGGQNYFDKWPKSAFPGAKTMFPIGHWAVEGLDSQASLDQHKGRVNMFVEDGYAANNWQNNLKSDGFYSIGQHTKNGGSLVTDEVDQWAGAGWGAWNGKIGFGDSPCTSGKNDCGFTIQKALSAKCDPAYFKYINYGKMAGFQADKAEFATWQSEVDVLSTDVYFFQEGDENGSTMSVGWWGISYVITDGATGGDLAGNDPRIRRPSNYGRVIKHLRDFQGGTKPIWSFHEIVDMKGNPVDPAKFTAGLWSAVVNGARGIVYFTHNYLRKDSAGNGNGYANSFADPKFSAVDVAAKKFYSAVQQYAPVLHGPDAKGLVSSSSADIDVLAKWNNGSPVLFTVPRDSKKITTTFTVKGKTTGTVTVVGENRTIPLSGGKFTDTFADGNAVHIYEVK